MARDHIQTVKHKNMYKIFLYIRDVIKNCIPFHFITQIQGLGLLDSVYQQKISVTQFLKVILTESKVFAKFLL